RDRGLLRAAAHPAGGADRGRLAGGPGGGPGGGPRQLLQPGRAFAAPPPGGRPPPRGEREIAHPPRAVRVPDGRRPGPTPGPRGGGGTGVGAGSGPGPGPRSGAPAVAPPEIPRGCASLAGRGGRMTDPETPAMVEGLYDI